MIRGPDLAHILRTRRQEVQHIDTAPRRIGKAPACDDAPDAVQLRSGGKGPGVVARSLTR